MMSEQLAISAMKRVRAF